MKKNWFQKKYNYGILVVLWSHSCNFFWNQIFSFSKKITSVGSANTCKFFDIFKKNYKCWIKCISKKITTTGSTNTCNFFGNENFLISKKITTMGSKHHLNPIVVFFFKSKFFYFQKKLQVLVDPVVVNFFEIHLIQHL